MLALVPTQEGQPYTRDDAGKVWRLYPFIEGTYVREGGWNSGVVSWSDDGQRWHDVQIGYIGGINAFAFGFTR